MKKFFSTILLSLLLVISAQAVPAHKGKVTVTQPDGTTVTLRLHGDEYLHFTTTDDGYSVVKSVDGFYRYARLDGGKLVATDVVAHDATARTAEEISLLTATEKYLAPEMSTQMTQMKQQNR